MSSKEKRVSWSDYVVETTSDKADVYKIVVYPEPDLRDNPDKPYLWCIVGWNKTAWCIGDSGWAKTPEEAFAEAIEYHRRFHLEDGK